jgi:hypothetical protein
MKNFLVAFLAFIFSVQGAVAALGMDTPAAPPAYVNYFPIWTMDAGDTSDNTERPQVSPAHEELSDYVVFHLAEHKARHAASIPKPPLIIPLSIDLPRIKPPPRA